MRWSGATGAIARCKSRSTACAHKYRSVPAWHWICGVKPKPKAVNKPSPHSITHGLDKPGVFTTLSPEYTFKHALTHEVAYGSLLLERRRVLHARIVGAIEALAPERVAEGASGAKGLPAGRQVPDQVERLAHHALRGEVWDKALAYCRQAGEKALARSAHSEAVGYFEQALSALPHLSEQHDTREQAIDLRLALRTALTTAIAMYRAMEMTFWLPQAEAALAQV